MKTNLSGISKIFQDYLRDSKPSAGAYCPAPERLVLCVLGEVPSKERAEIIGHAGDCATCAAMLKSVLALSAETERATAELESFSGHRKSMQPQNKRLSWARPAIKPALALVGGILFVAVLIVTVPRLVEQSGKRGGVGARVALIYPVKGGSIRDGFEFRWRGVAGSEYYIVEVFDKSIRLVWRSGRVSATETRIPAEAGRLMKRGETFYWMVTAVTDNDVEIKSGLAEFMVR